jgi:hypothetical protein
MRKWEDERFYDAGEWQQGRNLPCGWFVRD